MYLPVEARRNICATHQRLIVNSSAEHQHLHSTPMSSTRLVPTTLRTGMLAQTLPPLQISIRLITTRRRSTAHCLTDRDSGMIKYLLLILFVANHISRCLAWSWTAHQTPPDLVTSAPRVAEDVLLNNFDGDRDFITARFFARLTTMTRKPNSHRQA